MIAAIIQARMCSTRLPGKVLLDLNGKPLIEQIVGRIRYCSTVDNIVVATTMNPQDKLLEDWCISNKISCFRGDEENVLKRYCDAAKASQANVIVRVTADDPFKDPKVIDAVVKQLIDDKLDFSHTCYPVSFPEGIDIEAFTFEAIKRANDSDTTNFEKEHVTQYFYHNPNLFKMKNYMYTSDMSNLRLTVDSEEDYQLAKAIYQKLSPNGEMFYLEDIVQLSKSEPELFLINSNVERSAMYAK